MTAVGKAKIDRAVCMSRPTPHLTYLKSYGFHTTLLLFDGVKRINTVFSRRAFYIRCSTLIFIEHEIEQIRIVLFHCISIVLIDYSIDLKDEQQQE